MSLLYPTYAEVNLEHIEHNIRLIKGHINNKKLLIAVKANGYGHGAVAISKMAEKKGLVDMFGVATTPEAIELRKHGIRLPILKFSHPFPCEIDSLIDNNITITVVDETIISILQEKAKKKKREVKVHLKIDTGMGRIGCFPEEASKLCCFIEDNCPNLRLEGVFTHLPASSDSKQRGITQQQIVKFKQCIDEIEKNIGRNIDLVHCANSGGIVMHPNSWFNMVRSGILIYGYQPDSQSVEVLKLRRALSLYSSVSFVKKVGKGTPIGYGGTWIAPKDTFIATFPAGYADGISKLLSNKGHVLIKGKKCPIVGQVCMDQTMVDLGENTTVKMGDKVTIIGKDNDVEITADDIARLIGTISYDVTCSIGERVTRLYQ